MKGKKQMSKTILITGAGSGLGRGAAIGLAQKGHQVVATVEISPQVTSLREEAASLNLANLHVEKLDLLDPYDVAYAQRWDIDVLVNNAAIGETGPVSEIPIELMRHNFVVNLFAPLVLTQGFVRKWVMAKRPGKVVWMSSMGGLFTPPGFGAYVATKHAMEAIAESMQHELRPFNIKVQTINPGAYLTGFNETMAENAFRWLDDSKNFTKRAELRATFDSLLGTPEGRMDPDEMIAKMVEIIPEDTGNFRNVWPPAVEEMLKEHQEEAWDAKM
jgi:NAD(P)-dependent dehydrogenase (short-subunit alcohol dehydrogenase family)